jgi:TrmH family RNA methyltransferase
MSLTKSKLKELKELSHKKYRDENKLFLVEGVRLVHEAVHSDFHMVAAYYTDEVEKDLHGKSLIQSLKHKADMMEKVNHRELETICHTEEPQGVVAVLRQKESNPDALLKCSDGQCTLVAFDGVADPGNVGSWFGRAIGLA